MAAQGHSLAPRGDLPHPPHAVPAAPRRKQAAQRRYVLLALWMARNGCGALPGKVIVDAARRLRIS